VRSRLRGVKENTFVFGVLSLTYVHSVLVISQALGFSASSFHFINVDVHRYGTVGTGTHISEITRMNFTLDVGTAFLYKNVQKYVSNRKVKPGRVHTTGNTNASNNTRSVWYL
jgi:hypothetical protein